MQAINLYDSIHIKGVRPILSGRVIESSPQEIGVQYGENAYLFIFRFGCLVFFNMPSELIQSETEKIKAALGPSLTGPTSETYQVNVGDFAAKVEFEYVELKKLSVDYLRIIARTVGQSASLEYFEISADRMLADTSNFMRNLARRGVVPLHTNRLLKIIGSTASARQHVIANLSILDPPEETWKSKELEKLYKELQANFDIEVRFRTLDRKLTLVQDNIEVLADLTSSRRSSILEVLVVLLIIIELFLAVLHKG